MAFKDKVENEQVIKKVSNSKKQNKFCLGEKHLKFEDVSHLFL